MCPSCRSRLACTLVVAGLTAGPAPARANDQAPAPGAAQAPSSASPWRIHFTAEEFGDLPGAGNAWSLLETAEPFSIVDRLDNGGLFGPEPARLGRDGSSWTQTTFRLGDADITDPVRTGIPLVYPALLPVETVDVVSAVMPVELSGPGAQVTLVPKRADAAWRGSLQAAFTPAGLQSTNARPDAPSVTRYASWAEGSFIAGGPFGASPVSGLVAGSLTSAKRYERADPARLDSEQGTIFGHVRLTPRPGDEVSIVGLVQGASYPSPGRALFRDQDIAEDDTFWQFHGTWNRQTGAGHSWNVEAGYQRGVFDPNVDPTASGGAVERLLDGPVPALVDSTAGGVRERWRAFTSVRPHFSGAGSGRHQIVAGGGFEIARARTWSSARPIVGELVNGLAARVWDYGVLGPEALWTSSTLSAYASDEARLTSRLTVGAGLRLDHVRGTASGGATPVRWTSVAPRLSATWSVDEAGRTIVFGGYAHYGHRLPLDYLAVGDRAAAAGWDYRWTDLDGDRLVGPGETGPLIAAVGPCCSGSVPNTIDPALEQPWTREFVIGVERVLGQALVLRLVGLDRRERHLVELVDVGVTDEDYTVLRVPDPGTDWVGGTTEQLLPVYDRHPESFGLDRYELTNPPDLGARFQGLELTIDSTPGRRWWMRFGASASRAEGSGGNRGFRVGENDQGVPGELGSTPNARTFARGRLFFDRAFAIKWAITYRAPRDIRAGAVARYQDGQPFARVVIAPDLAQGPEPIPAYPRGATRFTYTLTLDARVEKRLRVGPGLVALVLEGFNLLNAGNEVEEDVVSSASFRTATAVQPPRALRVGVRVDF
jgi:hypothetical protein